MIRTILGFLGFIIAGAVFFLYTQPAYSTVQDLQGEISQYNLALDKATELQKLKQTLTSRRNSFDPAKEAMLHNMLPDHVDNIRLILDFDNIASHFGMALQNVVISNPASESTAQTVIGSIGAGKQKYDSLTLKFATRGTYPAFVQFLETLESSLRIVDLVSLSIVPEASPVVKGVSVGASQPTYRYNVVIRTYWLR